MSPPGTYRTCRAKLTMSVDGGKADLALGCVEVSFWDPKRTSADLIGCIVGKLGAVYDDETCPERLRKNWCSSDAGME